MYLEKLFGPRPVSASLIFVGFYGDARNLLQVHTATASFPCLNWETPKTSQESHLVIHVFDQGGEEDQSSTDIFGYCPFHPSSSNLPLLPSCLSTLAAINTRLKHY